MHPANPRFSTGTHPMMDEEEEAEEELQNKHSLLSRQSIAFPEPAPVVVVICEPWGLGNPITMGIKTSKA